MIYKATAQTLPPLTQLPDELITVQEAARYLKVCQQTVYNLMDAGKLRTFRVGKKRRISQSELLKYLGGDSAVDATVVTIAAAGDAAIAVGGVVHE